MIRDEQTVLLSRSVRGWLAKLSSLFRTGNEYLATFTVTRLTQWRRKGGGGGGGAGGSRAPPILAAGGAQPLLS